MVLLGTESSGKMTTKSRKMKSGVEEVDGTAVRKRILGAALSAFMEGGFAQTSTLEIATRARVSKRELYTLFGNKEAMLVA
jgi:AcrR family transcriptional regulator